MREKIEFFDEKGCMVVAELEIDQSGKAWRSLMLGLAKKANSSKSKKASVGSGAVKVRIVSGPEAHPRQKRFPFAVVDK